MLIKYVCTFVALNFLNFSRQTQSHNNSSTQVLSIYLDIKYRNKLKTKEMEGKEKLKKNTNKIRKLHYRKLGTQIVFPHSPNILTI